MADNLLTLGKGVYLSKPVTDSVVLQREKSSLEPTVIIIFSWSEWINRFYEIPFSIPEVGARLPHLLKYSNVYREMYPGATQIIVRSEASFFWSSESSKRAYLEPAVLALDSLGCLPHPDGSKTVQDGSGIEPLLPSAPPRVLVHAFSNGGSSQLPMLGDILKSRALPPGQKYPETALVLDSCPGDGGVDGTIRAFSEVVRNPILRAIVRFVIRLLYLYAAAIQRITSSRRENMLDRMKARLNDNHLLPWFDQTTTPRLYLYSLTDALIPFHEVEKHAAQAEALGFRVKLERFEDSAHVAHAKAYPDKYWAAIRSLWEDACGRT